MKEKKSKYRENEKGELEKQGFLSWFSNFFYYYKSYVIVAVVVIGFIVALFLSMRSTQADIHIKTVSNFPITTDDMTPFYEKLDVFMVDVDNDGVKYMQTENICIVDEPQNQNERDQYKLLEDALNDKEVACLIVDEYAYDYLLENNALRDLAFFGIESEEEYRIKLTGLNIFDGVAFDSDMYFVMKYMPDEEYEDYFTSLMTSNVVDIFKAVFEAEK